MNPVTALFGVLTATAIVMAAFSPERRHSFVAAMVVGLTWIISALILPHAPKTLIAWPLQDLVAGCAMVTLWQHNPRRWKMAFILSLLAQSGLHAAFWVIAPPEYRWLYRYEAAVNVLFAFQLCATAFPGTRNVVRMVGNSLFRLARLGFHTGLQGFSRNRP